MAEASIQVRPEIVEMPVPVTRENAIVVGGITGVFPEGTLEITENGNYDVVTKEWANVTIEQDPESFLNPEIDINLDPGNPNVALDFLAGFIKDIPVLQVAENVTQLAPAGDVWSAIMSGKNVKVTGGSSALVNVNTLGQEKSGHGPLALDLSELIVSPTAMFSGTCQNNTTITEAYLPRQAVVAPSVSNTFRGCSSLRIIDLGGVTSQGSNWNTFQNTSALERLIIRNDSAVLAAMGPSTFSGSAIAAGTCQIYVPDSLVNAYKSNSVWSAYAAQIHPLSELPEE